jgi:hypothetical protein
MSLFHRKAQPVSTAPPAPDTSPLVVPGLEAYAARAGWTALGAQPFRESFGDFVTSVSAAFVGESSNTSGAKPSGVSHITTYHSGYGGDLDGKSFAVANAVTSGYKASRVSVAQLWLPVAKLVDITLHGRLRKPWGFKTDEAAFDDQFRVSARDEAFAHLLLAPELRALLLERDDWAFMMGFYSVTCVCSEPFGTVDDVTARLAFLQTLVRAVPADVASDQTSALPKLPDGTVIDLTHEENLRDTLLKLTPEEQAQVLDQFPHMTPEKRAQIISQVMQHKDHDSA